MSTILGLDSSLKRGIFSGYVGLWVSSHILVYSSRLAGAPAYNATSVVLITEAVKLCLALTLYVIYDANAARGGAWTQLVGYAGAAPELPLKYMVPALLYCAYNNLVYTNLAAFDPGTYNVLMQLRIVFTGLLYQVCLSGHKQHIVLQQKRKQIDSRRGSTAWSETRAPLTGKK